MCLSEGIPLWIMPSRSLYIFDADEAPSTYLTNYLITAICWFGVVSHFLLKPSKRAPPPSFSAYEMFPPATLLLLHQILFGVVMLIGGLGHQVFKYDKCPGLEMPANITVPCPAPPNNEPCISAYLLVLGPAEFLIIPVAISVSGLADKCGATAYKAVVAVSGLLGVAAGIFGYVRGHDGFLPLGALLVLVYLLLLLFSAVGLCVERGVQVRAKVLTIVACIIILLSMAEQQLISRSCGKDAYLIDGAASCPFGGNGVTGINHNAVYHIGDAIGRLVLIFAIRALAVAKEAGENVNPGNLGSVTSAA